MFEKVNPKHPDKIADRIAGAIVDVAYSKERNPKIAVEVLIGHGQCVIITESSIMLNRSDIVDIVTRIAGNIQVAVFQYSQDKQLAANQETSIKCGDNGIFKGVPISDEQLLLTNFAKRMYDIYPSDGKYVIDAKTNKLIVCQSNALTSDIAAFCPLAVINPLGDWRGGLDVDTGATNRKLGSDMGDSVTGGGLHGKDLSKADVSVNIYAFLKAQKTGKPVEICCAIGDDKIDGKDYNEIVEIAREYIKSVGGFEKFAEWGLIR